MYNTNGGHQACFLVESARMRNGEMIHYTVLYYVRIRVKIPCSFTKKVDLARTVDYLYIYASSSPDDDLSGCLIRYFYVDWIPVLTVTPGCANVSPGRY